MENQKSYRYDYDKAGKLKEAMYQMHSGAAWSKELDNQNEGITYDRNGNIVSLQRNQRKHRLSGVVASYEDEMIDDLNYSYNNIFGDRLEKVVDGAVESGFSNGGSGTESDYTYDLNGSLTSDKNKGIDSIHYNFLGKIRRIKFADGTVITYSYDAMGTKLAMRRYMPGNSTPVVTDYAGSFVYENGQLLFFGSPEGRVVKNGNNFEYQYAIADHQGNTRVVFTSAVPSVTTPTTGFESDPGDLENYPSGGSVSALPLFNRTPGGTHSELLNGGYSSQVGVAKSFKVYPGDKVKIQAYAKYEDVPGPGNGQGFATALLQAFSLPAPAAGETGTPSSALETWGNLVDAGVQGNDPAPLAFVSIVIFDKNFDFLDAAWTQINASAKQVGASPDVPHDELAREYSIDAEGYVFMYVSNNSPVNVYFDDVTFTYSPTNVIQYNEYYPFGLQTSNSWTREDNRNNYLYNAGSELNATSGWYETFLRGYDPALGRFLQVDPLATKYSSQTPYNYAVNNPVMLNDPSGGDALPDGIPDWVDYRMEMIRRYMNGGTGVMELQRSRSQKRWSSNGNDSEGVSISPEYYGVIANTINNGGKLFIGENSWSYIYLDVGAGVQVNQEEDPIEGTEYGENIFYFDEIDLAIGLSFKSQKGEYDGNLPGSESDFIYDNNNEIGIGIGILEPGFGAAWDAVRAAPGAYTNGAKIISRAGGIGLVGLNVAVTGYVLYQEIQNGTFDTHSIVNGAVTVVGVGLTITGLVVSAPVVAIVGASIGIGYGIAQVAGIDGWIDNNWGFNNKTPK